jgi:hypothetical protein
VVLNYLILPVIHSTVTFVFLFRIILVFYVHSSVVCVVTHLELVDLLREEVWLVVLVLGLLQAGGLFLELKFGLLTHDELVNRVLIFKSCLLL